MAALTRKCCFPVVMLVFSGTFGALFSIAQAGEYRVKAAFLLNFVRFIDWPDTSFPKPDSPLRICVTGEDPFGRVLDEIVAGENINSHKLVVERISWEYARSCQVVFVGHGETDVRKILGHFGPGVLTIGEQYDFIASGGMIAFDIEKSIVRFDINQSAARAASLRISSRMLASARTVRTERMAIP